MSIYVLRFTQPIIALVTADDARDSRQDSQINQGLVQQLCYVSCIPICECFIHKSQSDIHQGCVLAADSFATGVDWLLERTVGRAGIAGGGCGDPPPQFIKAVVGGTAGPAMAVPLFCRACNNCSIVFTARCTLVQSAVLRSHVVSLSIRL